MRVDEMHVNFWCLSTHTRYDFVCDIGLMLSIPATADDLKQVEVALPFEPRAAVEDLHDAISGGDHSTRLVFGERVSPMEPAGQRVRLQFEGGRQLILVKVKTESVESCAVAGRPNQDLWTATLPFRSPITAGTDHAYIRARFHVHNYALCWKWRRGLGVFRDGALADLRVNDVRESGQVDVDQELEEKISAIHGLNFLVIAPWDLQARVASPDMRYTRILEQDAWSRYLHRPANLRRQRKSLVYYWRVPNTDVGIPTGSAVVAEQHDSADLVVDTANPFRAFLDLGVPEGHRPVGDHLVTALATAAAVVGLPELSDRIGGVVVAAILGLLSLLGATASLWAAWLLDRATEGDGRLRRQIRRVQDSWWRRRQQRLRGKVS